jgi:hypothetical protein
MIEHEKNSITLSFAKSLNLSPFQGYLPTKMTKKA